jgi:hypothetical protein
MAGDTDGDWAGVARMAFLTALRWLMRDFFSTDMAFLLFRLVSVWTAVPELAQRLYRKQADGQTAGHCEFA